MDSDTTLTMSGNEDFENGLHQIEELGENLENDHVELNEDKNINSAQEITEPECHSTSSSKELRGNESDDSKNPKPLKSMGRGKSGKPLSKSIDGSNIASEPRTRQTSTLNTKSKSLNERQGVDSSTAPTVQNKQHGVPDTPLSSTSGEQSEELPEKAKLKALRKGPTRKTEEISQSSSSPPAGDAKPLKLGSLPAYSFSFKCNERAEKRKEFYSKLEEKIQAKEAEKNNLEAKTKESQDAEIKMLRKKLGFKATPMPSFYQEPMPPKVELKKIPITRAKSPKIGRRKISPATDTEESGERPERPARLSLDAKLSQSHLAGSARGNHVRKPHRQSLPMIPFEDTEKFSYEKKKALSRKSTTTTTPKGTGESDEVLPNVLSEETSKAAGSDEPTQEEGTTNIDDKLPEAREETIQVQEVDAD